MGPTCNQRYLCGILLTEPAKRFVDCPKEVVAVCCQQGAVSKATNLLANFHVCALVRPIKGSKMKAAVVT